MRIEDRWKAVVTNIQFHLAALILGANQKSHDLWEDWEQKCEWVKFDKETETSEVLLTLSCKGQESYPQWTGRGNSCIKRTRLLVNNFSWRYQDP